MRPFDVIIAAHGPLAAGLAASASTIAGQVPGMSAVDLQAADTPEAYRDRLAAALEPGRPTLVLADLAGGTPHNVASALQARNPLVRCVAGANLGLVIEALTTVEPLGDGLLGTLVERAREGITARHVGSNGAA